jgi:GGDEF domain-containing protein
MAKSRSSKRKSRSHDSLQQVEEAQVLDRVSFRLRPRESVLGWTLAAYTAWVGIVVAPGQWMPWIGVFVAGFVAAWARLSPALRPGKVALRYCLLVFMGVLLMGDPQLGSSTGYMLFWPLAICCAASLMLRERWAMVVVVAAMVGFIVASLSIQPRVPWVQVSSALVAIVALTSLAYAFGSSLRATDAQLEAAMTDLKTKLYNEAGFFTYGNELMLQCHARKKPLAMVLLNGADLRDIHDIVGRITSERLISQTVQGITSALPPGGLAAHMGRAEFAILVPEASEARALELVRHKLGDPPSVRLKVGQRPVAVIFDMVGTEVPADARSLEPFYERMYARLAKMRRGLDAPTTLSEAESFMPDFTREISPTLPMELMRKG